MLKHKLFLTGIFLILVSSAIGQISFVKIAESSNLYSIVRNQDNPLSYHSPGRLAFIHRQNVMLHGGQPLDNGLLRIATSTDSAQTWDTERGPVNPQYVNVGRYPSLTLNQLPGIAGPSLIFAAPSVHSGYPTVSTWDGGVFGLLKNPPIPFSSPDQEAYYFQSSTTDQVPLSSLCGTETGTFWAASTTFTNRTISIHQGTYDISTGQVDWGVNKTFEPSWGVNVQFVNVPQISFERSGKVGYLAMPGDLRDGFDDRFQIVYTKTKDGGNSWDELRELHFTDFPQLVDSIGGTPGAIGDFDLLVDQDSVPHFLITLGLASETAYSVYVRGTPLLLVDFTLDEKGEWEARIVSDLKTLRAQLFSTAAINPLSEEFQNNKQQISQDSEGRIYYHWVDSDTLQAGYATNSGNSKPNLLGRAYDPVLKKATEITTWTTGIPGWENRTTMVHVAPYFNSTEIDHVPIVAPDLNNYTEPLSQVSIYYVKGVKYDQFTSDITSYPICLPGKFDLQVSAVESSCGMADGSITVLAGPVEKAPFTYQWQNGDSTNMIADVTSGFHQLLLTDQYGCSLDTMMALSDSGSLVLTDSVFRPSCAEETHTIECEVSGGQAPYWVSWSNQEPTLLNQGLVPGTYYLEVSDLYGCKTTEVYSLEGPMPLTIDITGTDLTCYGDSSGGAKAFISGGVAPYTFSWSHGPQDLELDQLAAGCYEATVEDALGCVKTAQINITEPDELTIGLSTFPSSLCTQPPNGFMTCTVQGGSSSNYQYNWTGSGGFTQSGSSIIFGLFNGVYTIEVIDGNGCKVSETTELTQSTPPIQVSTAATHASCQSQTGSIALTITSGAQPFTYEWSNGSTSKDLNNVPPGEYWVTVTDVNGCSVGILETILSKEEKILESTSVITPVCFSDSLASISLDPNGLGFGIAALQWSNGETGLTIDSLQSGSYHLTVTDSSGCATSVSFQISLPDSLYFQEIQINAICKNSSTGSAGVEVCGGATPYQYLWSTGETNKYVSPLFAGTYQIEVTDARGCVIEDSVVIAPYVPFSQILVSDAPCAGKAGGIILPQLNNPNDSWTWGDSVLTLSRYQVSAGSYSLSVASEEGCQYQTEIVVNESPVLVVDALSEIDTIANMATLISLPDAGTPPYTYQWNDLANSQDSVVTGIQDTGVYVLVVYDSQNCFDTASVSVQGLSLVSVSQTLDDLMLSVFPNPLREYLTISWSPDALKEGGNIQLFSTSGQLITEVSFGPSERKKTLDLSQLSEGRYFLRWRSGGYQVTKTLEKRGN